MSEAKYYNRLLQGDSGALKRALYRSMGFTDHDMEKPLIGLLMAAARLDIPAIFVNGGPMYPASYRGKHYDGNIVTEAVGWKTLGKIDEEEFARIERLAEPCAGS